MITSDKTLNAFVVLSCIKSPPSLFDFVARVIVTGPDIDLVLIARIKLRWRTERLETITSVQLGLSL